MFLVVGIIAIAFGLGWKIYKSPWPVGTTLRHIAAAPNCAAARSVGLAPATHGSPGYYYRQDADNDGVACEPYPRR